MSRPLGSRYQLDELIGTGGMGEVWRGHDTDQRVYAVKLLRAELTADPSLVARFLQERTILGSVAHPNVVSVHDLVAEGDSLGIVMDFVEGRDLRHELGRRRNVAPAEALVLCAGILDGLAAIHAAGVVHRDLKPENVLLEYRANGPWPRVTDFGVSLLISKTRLTRQTSLIGTPEYMSPEQAESRSITPASDLYSVGVLLYELLCGVTPFAGGHPLAVLRRHVDSLPGRPPGLPDPVWNLLTALTAKDPLRRGSGAAEAAQYMRHLAAGLGQLPAAPALDEPPLPVPIAPVTQASSTVAAPPVHAPQPPLPPAASEPRPQRRRRARLILTALAVIVLLAAGATGALILTNHDSSRAASPNPGPSGTTTGPRPSPSASSRLVAMPDLTGKTLGDAQDALLAGGVPQDQIRVTDQLDETKPDATVLSQQPKPGAPISGDVTLNVARQPQVSYLSDLSPAEGSANEDAVDISGKSYPHSIYLSVVYDAGDVQYDLGRNYRRFRATIGLTDDSGSSASVLYEVFADGRRIYNATLGLGQTRDLDIDMTGVLRLDLRAKSTTEAPCCPAPDVNAAFGDARILAPAGTQLPSASPTP